MTFEVREGEVLSLIGPNGAGKTIGLQRHHRLHRARRRRNRLSRRAAQWPQAQCRSPRSASCARSRRPASSPGQTALDNVLIGLHLRSRQRPLAILARPAVGRARGSGSSRARPREILRLRRAGGRARDARRPRAALRRVAPAGGRDRAGRQTQAAAARRAGVGHEPGGDRELHEDAGAASARRGITVLLVEHDMKMVMGVSDRIVCLNQGRIIASGTPAEIQRRPRGHPRLSRREIRAQGLARRAKAAAGQRLT